VVVATGYWWKAAERSGCSDWLLVDGLGAYCLKRQSTVGQAGERSVYSEWLRVDGLWNVVGIMTGYWWTG